MEKIEHIQYIKTPVGKVYETLTTERGLAETWTRKLKVKPGLGVINEFDFDDNYSTKMKVIELIPDSRIIWECVESDPEWVGTTISYELAEENGVTSVVLRHLNWRELTEFYRWCNYNWAMFLYSLKTYCEEGTGMPFQTRKF